MADPAYVGFILEQMGGKSLEPAIFALEDEVLSQPMLRQLAPTFFLSAFDVGDHVWLSLRWDDTDHAIFRWLVGASARIAPTLARACGSAVWSYGMMSASTFTVSAARYDEKGDEVVRHGGDESTDVDIDPANDDFDAAELLVAKVNHALAEALGWDAELLPDTGTEQGIVPPRLEAAATERTFQLVPRSR